MQLAVARADRVQVRGVQLGRRDLAALDQPDRVLGREPQRVDDGSHQTVGGTRKRSPSRAAALAKTSSSASESWGSSSSQTFTTSSGCEVGSTSLEVELGDDADRLEDRAELAREALDLLLCEREPREPRDVQHLVSRYRHRRDPLKEASPLSGARTDYVGTTPVS